MFEILTHTFVALCECKTSQELRMLSSVTLNCQVTKMVMIQVLNFLKCQQSHTILQAMSLSLSLVRFNMSRYHSKKVSNSGSLLEGVL